MRHERRPRRRPANSASDQPHRPRDRGLRPRANRDCGNRERHKSKPLHPDIGNSKCNFELAYISAIAWTAYPDAPVNTRSCARRREVSAKPPAISTPRPGSPGASAGNLTPQESSMNVVRILTRPCPSSAQPPFLTPAIDSAIFRTSEHYAPESAKLADIGLGQPGPLFICVLPGRQSSCI